MLATSFSASSRFLFRCRRRARLSRPRSLSGRRSSVFCSDRHCGVDAWPKGNQSRCAGPAIARPGRDTPCNIICARCASLGRPGRALAGKRGREPDAVSCPHGHGRRALATRLGDIEGMGEWQARYALVHRPNTGGGDVVRLELRNPEGRLRLSRALPRTGTSCTAMARRWCCNSTRSSATRRSLVSLARPPPSGRRPAAPAWSWRARPLRPRRRHRPASAWGCLGGGPPGRRARRWRSARRWLSGPGGAPGSTPPGWSSVASRPWPHPPATPASRPAAARCASTSATACASASGPSCGSGRRQSSAWIGW